ncbi:MAG: MFS transporter [Muribaculaceae bacterium]|nr:MFS transporter [Muribaculaceae bacterium]
MKGRLSLLYFLQFSVWGCYLTCLSQFLGAGGLGNRIAWFYAAIGIISLITPPLLGNLADKSHSPKYLLGMCHFGAGVLMLALWYYAKLHPTLEFIPTYALYLGFLAFYMPTMALSNTVTFRLLDHSGINTISTFPHIRIWGTVGFVAAMWFVNCAYWHDGNFGFTLSDNVDPDYLRFQYNYMQLLCSGVMALFTAIYAFSLPEVKVNERAAAPSPGSRPRLFYAIKSLLGSRQIAIFLIFVILSGVCLQISNGFATPYITHFTAFPEFAGSLAAGNATMLFSLSQIAEAFCILLVGVSLKYKGIRWVYAIGLVAWGLRFLMLGLGNPTDRLWLLIGSMLMYGIAFNFITIAGHLHIQQVTAPEMKGLAQGAMMFMGNGIGATCGIFIAGAIVNHWCRWEMVSLGNHTVRLFMGEWITPWLIFAAYSAGVAILWLLFYRFRMNES